MTQITSGVYHPGDSTMHSLDATVKLICSFLLLLAVLTTETPTGYAGMILFTVAAAYLARLDKKRALSTVRKFWWLLMLVILSNFAFYAPKETFGAWWVFTPSYKGLFMGLGIAVRIGIILVLANVLSSTTSPLKLVGALETVLAPLAYLKVPVDRFIAAFEISARLLPTLFEDAEYIKRVQKARGTDFNAKGFLNKASIAKPLVLPLVLTAFRRADTLSLVMEARGFKPGAKAFAVKKPELSVADWAALLVCASVCAMQIIIL